ncbi:hypothetical protein FIBSPDRAFT_874908 [Athelia psychrophila]|uniref:Uncharacterized protein n=1 Tax=Athelia psychrophila TaxID=1759441 RepID=A0A165WWE0_9AGAM|nr:hypothetical protein FIBSPDRAFT_874908 [Fibularhizoctonia sp. CBS 109695]
MLSKRAGVCPRRFAGAQPALSRNCAHARCPARNLARVPSHRATTTTRPPSAPHAFSERAGVLSRRFASRKHARRTRSPSNAAHVPAPPASSPAAAAPQPAKPQSPRAIRTRGEWCSMFPSRPERHTTAHVQERARPSPSPQPPSRCTITPPTSSTSSLPPHDGTRALPRAQTMG